MSRFIFTPGADRDFDSILDHLDTIPAAPARRIAQELQQIFHAIGDNPYLGSPHSDLTLLAGSEVRSRRCPPYRIYYTMTGRYAESLGIVHTSRDLPDLMEKRLQ